MGEIHITGIVNVSGFMEYFVFQNTSLHLVMEMAKTIANGIYQASLYYKQKPSFSDLKHTAIQDHEKTNEQKPLSYCQREAVYFNPFLQSIINKGKSQ